MRHTSGGTGALVSRPLGPPLPHLLTDRSVCSPLGILLREEGVVCERLGEAVRQCTWRDLRMTTTAYWDDAANRCTVATQASDADAVQL